MMTERNVKVVSTSTLSPLICKIQLREKCIQRIHANRKDALRRARCLDGEMAKNGRKDMREALTPTQLQRNSVSPRKSGTLTDQPSTMENTCHIQLEERYPLQLEELMEMGKLSDAEYWEIVHSLEEEIWNDTNGLERSHFQTEDDERLAEEMMRFEGDSLAALLQNIDIDVER
uniref:AlNc14C215G9002 protein n=1 Tax=Albugo laibachii Nc14 TaxID=890382 RepID=F0WRK2_9STRA|nr:AlNc14C215G9002 [Albugo laibachii Nc14]|eukprot:CCA23965.1 AlNc14C215G9002 [Albugo laibachii Nc14]